MTPRVSLRRPSCLVPSVPPDGAGASCCRRAFWARHAWRCPGAWRASCGLAGRAARDRHDGRRWHLPSHYAGRRHVDDSRGDDWVFSVDEGQSLSVEATASRRRGSSRFCRLRRSRVACHRRRHLQRLRPPRSDPPDRTGVDSRRSAVNAPHRHCPAMRRTASSAQA